MAEGIVARYEGVRKRRFREARLRTLLLRSGSLSLGSEIVSSKDRQSFLGQHWTNHFDLTESCIDKMPLANP